MAKSSATGGRQVGDTGNNWARAPSVSLPKGGGAIRGIGEKFSANPVTGTGSMSVPIATSPGRAGFGPQLSLSYDSGAGNGIFGFGWSLNLPQITRKTDKGLPQYDDAGESDVFLLSGAEDLVPELKKDATSKWVFEDGKHAILEEPRTVDGDAFLVRRYRPRIEGLFARIERWTRRLDGDVHWRSISKDNVLTIYGKDSKSRIADPEGRARVFGWLASESRDDKGNAIVYEYVPENGAGVDLTRAHERNRGTPDDPRRTANRYLKRIRYGNRTSLLDEITGQRPSALTDGKIQNARWMFEVVFDYGEHDPKAPKPSDTGPWDFRGDPFSSCRAGFEVRTTRLCQRVLMFHNFEDADVGTGCLVRSTDFTYSHEEDGDDVRNPVYTFLLEVTQSGYKRHNGEYLKRSLPALSFEYSRPAMDETVQDADADSLENLPIGLDGGLYQWTDLHGEGIPGVLSAQGGAWLYKRNLSPTSVKTDNGSACTVAKLAPVELVATQPNLALAGGQGQFMDLAGDGQPDLVVLSGPSPGLYEHDGDDGWNAFRPFSQCLNRDTRDPSVRFIDIDGDGHPDVLISEDGAFVWHRSLAEDGFGPGRRIDQAFDEEKGPRLVFADGTQSIYLADLNGDGLTDLLRLRNGEVCYWPNLGHGRFGAKVSMDNAPRLDHADQFDYDRIRLADIDGTGTTDIIYLHRDGARIYFNQSGNGWSAPQHLRVFPRTDDLISIATVDLLGNGTACLVWSSPLPGDAQRQMRYVNLMGRQKPHLLTKMVNGLGAETHMQYAPSTKFYLQDKLEGKPWITRLPFPVHVVERIETHDGISKNRFVTRYAYHHGHFDGEEREFRGFGMVEQWDTEEAGALASDGTSSEFTNVGAASHVPPVLTKTWFHTGIYLKRDHVSNFFAGTGKGEGEYYRAPELRGDDAHDLAAEALLLPDTVLPEGLSVDEEREACRALKGAMLRQEVYALDGTDKSGHPYTVTEQNFTIRCLQPRGENGHGVFFTYARETINYHYERNAADPRIAHSLTLEADAFGNVLRSVAVGYPRADIPERQSEQCDTHLTLTLNRVANRDDQPDWRRIGLPVESRTYEMVKPPAAARRFTWKETHNLVAALVPRDRHAPPVEHTIPYEQWDWRKRWDPQSEPGGLVDGGPRHTRLRCIEHVRALYRKDDLTGLLPLGEIQSLALPGETYKLALTPDLLAHVFKRAQKSQPVENLLPPDLAGLLEGRGGDQGGYVAMDGHWWLPSGKVFYDPGARIDSPALTASAESTTARKHFYLPRKFADPFDHSATVDYDMHDLLVTRTSDALGNTVTAASSYRVLQPRFVVDPNGNRTAAAFDVLGMVVATAVMGKEGESLGDLLEEFDPDPPLQDLRLFIADPRAQAPSLLGKATSRIIYDLDRYQRAGQPPFAATLARETHVHDSGGLDTKIQISFGYSDGFGREIQKKIQAESGDAPQREPDVPLPTGDIAPGNLMRDAEGRLVQANTAQRWVGSGRTVFNNKGKPVRKYEPFFSSTHLYEAETEMADTGVSPVLFYDPVERIVATLHPNHTYEKVVFDPWRQTTYDVNDSAAARDAQTGDPRTDPDIAGYAREYFKTQPATWQTWRGQRIDNQMGGAERDAAQQASEHADTPTVAHLDTLGRPCRTIAHNRYKRDDGIIDENYATRVEVDVEGNERTVIDAKGRVVMRYDYDLLGNRIHQASMEAGERWMLNDVAGNPIRAWDSRRFLRRMTYDELRRPTGLYVVEKGVERLAERTVYGEGQGSAANLRTRIYQTFDGAGVVTNLEYDFKGNLLASQRNLLADYKAPINWSLNPTANDGRFTIRTTYDALNRPLTVTSPDGSIFHPAFNEANILEKVEVILPGAMEPTLFVQNIDYNAKGQRERIIYGNGATTTYHYDPFTFRLVHMKSMRPNGLNGLVSSIFADPAIVQDLRYTYDPIGNIVRIEDTALKTVFNNGQQVEPVGRYTYDAVYRLIEAMGREHIGQTAFEFETPNGDHRDYPFVGHRHPNDLEALRNYIERYEYDEAGNFQLFRRIANGGGSARRYHYEEESFLELGKQSNQLSKTTVGNGFSRIERYGHDAHGNMTTMPHLVPIALDLEGDPHEASAEQLVSMVWDFEDQLHEARLGGGGTAYYVYDAGGQRMRKVIESQNGTRRKERLYFGGFEIHREYDGSGTTVKSERNTLHVMDDRQRIALVETSTIEDGDSVNAPAALQRYQLGNHLGSACVELDMTGALISYEEYHPYGTTAFQARNAGEVSLKRYRYTGKERDEESGLYYFGARYYAPWLGRWTGCDPVTERRANLYSYASMNPVCRNDPDGAQDEEATRIANYLQKLANQYLEPALRRLPEESAQAFGTRLHEIFSAGVHSSRHGPSGRIVTELIFDSQGNIIAYGGSPSEASSLAKKLRSTGLEVFTVDAGILKPDFSASPALKGMNVREVLAIGIDYKTGDAALQKRQKGIFQALEIPLERLKAGGKLDVAVKKAVSLNVRAIGRSEKTAARMTQQSSKTGGRLIKGLKKSVPLVGIYSGVSDIAENVKKGNWGRAVMETLGLIAEPVDWALLVYDVGSSTLERGREHRRRMRMDPDYRHEMKKQDEEIQKRAWRELASQPKF